MGLEFHKLVHQSRAILWRN